LRLLWCAFDVEHDFIIVDLALDLRLQNRANHIRLILASIKL
jgi:hypothetical protein